MTSFKSTEDLAKYPLSEPAHTTAQKLVDSLITDDITPRRTYIWQESTTSTSSSNPR